MRPAKIYKQAHHCLSRRCQKNWRVNTRGTFTLMDVSLGVKREEMETGTPRRYMRRTESETVGTWSSLLAISTYLKEGNSRVMAQTKGGCMVVMDRRLRAAPCARRFRFIVYNSIATRQLIDLHDPLVRGLRNTPYSLHRMSSDQGCVHILALCGPGFFWPLAQFRVGHIVGERFRLIYLRFMLTHTPDITITSFVRWVRLYWHHQAREG